MSTSIRRVVAAARPFIDRVDLRDRSASWGDDECFATKHVDSWIIVMVSPVTDFAHCERKDIGRDWDRGRR